MLLWYDVVLAIVIKFIHYIPSHNIFGGEQGAEEGVGHREEGGAVAMLSQFIDFATSMFLLFFYMAFQYTGIFQCYK